MSGLMLEVGQGLQYIHSQKIVHRDIACRNILVDARQPGELTKFLYDLIVLSWKLECQLKKTTFKRTSFFMLKSATLDLPKSTTTPNLFRIILIVYLGLKRQPLRLKFYHGWYFRQRFLWNFRAWTWNLNRVTKCDVLPKDPTLGHLEF